MALRYCQNREYAQATDSKAVRNLVARIATKKHKIHKVFKQDFRSEGCCHSGIMPFRPVMNLSLLIMPNRRGNFLECESLLSLWVGEACFTFSGERSDRTLLDCHSDPDALARSGEESGCCETVSKLSHSKKTLRLFVATPFS